MQVQDALELGLNTNKVGGTPGEINLSGVSCDTLDKGIILADQYGCVTVETRRLMQTTKDVRALRQAVMSVGGRGIKGRAEDSFDRVRRNSRSVSVSQGDGGNGYIGADCSGSERYEK